MGGETEANESGAGAAVDGQGNSGAGGAGGVGYAILEIA